MTPYPYGPPPWWWGKGKPAAGEAARQAIDESERLRKAGRLEPVKPARVTGQRAVDMGLFEEVANADA